MSVWKLVLVSFIIVPCLGASDILIKTEKPVLSVATYGPYVAVGLMGGGGIELWDLSREPPQKKWSYIDYDSAADVTTLHFLDDADHLLAGSTDNTLRQINVKSGQEDKSFRIGKIRAKSFSATIRREMRKIEEMSFSADGNRFTVKDSENFVRVFDKSAGGFFKLTGTKDLISVISFSTIALTPDGKYFVIPGADSLVVWDAETLAQKSRMPVSGYAMGAAFRPGSHDIALTCREGKLLLIRVKVTGADPEIPHDPTKKWKGTLPFKKLTAKEQKILAAGGILPPVAGKRDRDERTDFEKEKDREKAPPEYKWRNVGEIVRAYVWPGEKNAHEHGGQCVAFMVGDTYLVSGSSDIMRDDILLAKSEGSNNFIRIWKTDTGEPMCELGDGTYRTLCMATSPANYLITGHQKGFRVWRPADIEAAHQKFRALAAAATAVP